jgi:hypothetical protein
VEAAVGRILVQLDQQSRQWEAGPDPGCWTRGQGPVARTASGLFSVSIQHVGLGVCSIQLDERGARGQRYGFPIRLA